MRSFITSIEKHARFISGNAKIMRRKQKTCELSSKYMTCEKWLREMFYSLIRYSVVHNFKMNNSGKEKQKVECV